MVSTAGLHRARAFQFLWSARAISFFGDTIAQVALVLLAARQPSAALAVSLLLLAQTLPRMLGPFAGILADRVDQRLLMIGCELGQALVVTAIALLPLPFPLVLALVVVLSLLATLFLPAGQSALPALVAADDLGQANALLRLGFNISRALGPAIAGLFLAARGVPLVLLIDALTFLASAALLTRLPALLPQGGSSRPGVCASARAGLAYLSRQATARVVTLGLFLVTLFIALDNVGLIFLAQRSLRAGAPGYGLLLAGYGLGMVAGPLILIRLGRRLTTMAGLLGGIAVMGLGTALCGLAPTLASAVALQGVVGVGNGCQNVANDTLLQQSVPRPLLGRIFGVAYSVPYAALLSTYALGGVVLQLTSPRAVFVIAGLGTLATVPLLLALFPRRTPPEPVQCSTREGTYWDEGASNAEAM
jgi:MFS family permease